MGKGFDQERMESGKNEWFCVSYEVEIKHLRVFIELIIMEIVLLVYNSHVN